MNAFFDKIANNTKYSLLFLAAISLFFFIGLGNVHLFDWDEINFAESAREMIASKNYLRVQINYSPFWEKPPFFFWLQVGAMQLFGFTEFAARFPNALFGFLYLVTFYFIGKKHYSPRFGLIWALIFFASLLPHVYFKSGIIDPVFNYFIFLSIYFMMLVINGASENKMRLAVFAGVFSGLSVITKGPVGFLLLSLTLFVYLIIKRFKCFPKFKHIIGFLIGFVIILTTWLSMEVYQNGFGILIQFIEYQIELFNTPVAGHDQPFYYHFIVVFLGCFPMSIIALPYLFKSKEETPNDMRKWFIVLFWVVLILFSLSTTKIIHYSSMTYMPLSFIASLTIYKAMQNEYEFSKAIHLLYLIIGLVIGILITTLPIVIYNKEMLFPYINDPFAVESMRHAADWNGFEFIIGIIFLIGIIWSYIKLKRKKYIHFLFKISSTMSLTLLLVVFFILPKIESFTQGPAISFYEEIYGEDCYVESYGFKSYAQYYYFQVPAGLNEERKNQTWLLNGEVDKTVYMVSKITNNELDNNPNFTKVKTEGGFNFYKRELK